jgi:DtxR family Mn-dependent transcriptional regulator
LTKLGAANYNRLIMRRKINKDGLASKPLSASLEDYIEAIYNLSRESQVAHSKDIAATLGVKRPSVTGALRLLKARKLAHYTPYGAVALTEAGKKSAEAVIRKHNILNSFFADVLGLKQDVAQKTACRAEHALGEQAVKKLLHFIEFAAEESNNGVDMAAKFKKYCQRKSEI